MNAWLIVANVLTFLAFVVHTFIGDKDVRSIEPAAQNGSDLKKREQWTMVRAGWHLISIDLLCASIVLCLVNFTNYFGIHESFLVGLLAIYF